jgi:SET domain-containing protein
MKKPLVHIKKSKTGMGLFAGHDIKKGTKIIEYIGEIITPEEADKRGGQYLFEVNSKKTIDGSPRYNKARYINHECGQGNCDAIDVRGHIFIYAYRNLKEGEELTYNYGSEFFEEHIKPKGCLCRKCKPE